MNKINVNRNLPDILCPYQMPKIITQVEGEGCERKTLIVNIVEVAKAFNRPPTYPTKYLGLELGTETQFDFRNERYILNGSHEAAELQDLLDGFIKKFVLCPSCDNPETILAVNPKKGVDIRCTVCDHSEKLDSTHKLTQFIRRNTPKEAP